MDGTLSRLLESLTVDEQAEVATFAMFVLARRDPPKLQALLADTSTKERRHSILELRGLGKEIWKGIDGQYYVDQERRSWHE